MRVILMLAAIAALGWMNVSNVQAKEPNKDSSAKQEKKADAKDAELRAKIHRTMAELIEARAATNPDDEKIDALTARLAKLRQQARPASAGAAAPGAGWRCPMGGPNVGGRGPAWGGQGRGQGGGRGPAWGGPGRAQGGGGRGAGFGPGGGRGQGGPFYTDRDNDGVCDRFERAQGDK